MDKILKLKPKKGFEKTKRVAVPGKVYTFPPYEIKESEYPNVKKYFDIDVETHPKLEAPTPQKEKEKDKEKAESPATRDNKKEKGK